MNATRQDELSATKAGRLIVMFGGVRPFARAIGADPSSVLRWARPGGWVPRTHNRAVLDAARKGKLPLPDVRACLERNDDCAVAALARRGSGRGVI